ncbi:hypothetical protein CAMRE0001_2798 [Campylobacter rectus RM3267]|uniref:Uncharacterized protein n=1 Tax=Campylobacter rectus RM3267 TaxID=553218 RepID=B9D0Z1_CAMRE|nr:hypothetical protein CAMRE0001_2798 [Campylobacter rectus RM3267]
MVGSRLSLRLSDNLLFIRKLDLPAIIDIVMIIGDIVAINPFLKSINS